jgi:hypothetical protein
VEGDALEEPSSQRFTFNDGVPRLSNFLLAIILLSYSLDEFSSECYTKVIKFTFERVESIEFCKRGPPKKFRTLPKF